ncbi:hypothetical protein [Neorhodopirellula lusitana]|uniref:hypothetical protein n=1 Tax=Neorhodopirellula lusitana TaxID=445327 RepID=UPI00384D0CE2
MTEPLPANDPSGSASAAVAKAYVREMLDFNPMWDAPQIMRRRREVWGGTAVGQNVAGNTVTLSGAADAEADQLLRNRARKCLEVLQEKFYELPPEKLNQYIRALQNDRLPEYAAAAVRFQKAASVRDVLLTSQVETGDAKFSYSLQQCMVRPAAEGGALREQFIEAIIAERRVKPACEAVKKFLSAHPKVYALERDWFDLLTDPANQREWSASYSVSGKTRRFLGMDPSGGNTVGGSVKGWGTVALIVLVVVVRLAGVVSRSSKRNTRERATPTATTSPRQSSQRSLVNGSSHIGPSSDNGALVPAGQTAGKSGDQASGGITSNHSDAMQRLNEIMQQAQMERKRRSAEQLESAKAKLEAEGLGRRQEREKELRESHDRLMELTKPKSLGPGNPLPGLRPSEMPKPNIEPPNIEPPNIQPPSFRMSTPSSMPRIPRMRIVPRGSGS